MALTKLYSGSAYFGGGLRYQFETQRIEFLGGSWNHLECRITALRVRAAASGPEDDRPVPTAEIVAIKILNPPIFSGMKPLIVPR